MNKEEIFYNVINESINNAMKGFSNKIDAHLLTDIKRLTELGILTIETTQPEYKEFNGTFSATCFTRVNHIAEETITQLKQQLEECKRENEALARIINYLT